MKLQRLTYPFREASVPEAHFGASTGKFYSASFFFQCAATGAADVIDGELQGALDNLYDNRKAVVGQRWDGGDASTLYLLGTKDALHVFRDKFARFVKDSKGLTEKPLAEKLLEEFLMSPQSNNSQLHKNTMGWLEVDSGCFAMKSMTSLNRVRELFGMRPHVAMRAQKFNYGDW